MDSLAVAFGDLMVAIAESPPDAAGAARVVAAADMAAAKTNSALGDLACGPAMVSLGCVSLITAFGSDVSRSPPIMAVFADALAAAEAESDASRRGHVTDGAMVLFTVVSAVFGPRGMTTISQPFRDQLRRAARTEGAIGGQFVNAVNEAIVATRTPWRSAAGAAAASLGIPDKYPAAAARVSAVTPVGGSATSVAAGGRTALVDALADIPADIGLLWAVATATALPDRVDIWTWAAAAPAASPPPPAGPPQAWCRIAAALALARVERTKPPGSVAVQLRAIASDVAVGIRAAAPPRLFLPPIIL